MRWIILLLKVFVIVIVITLAVKIYFNLSFNPLERLYGKAREYIGLDSKNHDYVKKLPPENDNRGYAKEEENKGAINFESTQDEQVKSNKELIMKKNRFGEAAHQTGEYFIAPEEITLAEKVSISDKLTAIAILSKLRKEDIDNMACMADNGITYSEMKEIKHIMEQTLSEAEIDKLDEILMRNRKLYAEGKLEK